MNTIKVAELFAGVGGFRLGLEGYSNPDNPEFDMPRRVLLRPFGRISGNRLETIASSLPGVATRNASGKEVALTKISIRYSMLTKRAILIFPMSIWSSVVSLAKIIRLPNHSRRLAALKVRRASSGGISTDFCI